ncbi:MAG: hypothetical protein Q4D81_13700, partial [Eubacteriales bacterium]|nr:hypothetical protein [Eubacteriales bacterium]
QDGTEDRIQDGTEKAGESPRGVSLMLHAWKAEFVQPFTGEKIRISAALPDWAVLPHGIALEDI